MVVVDSLTAFYWSDRLSGGLQHMDSYLKRILSALQKSTKEHKVTVVFTRPSYFQSAAPPRFQPKGESGGSTRLISLSRFENNKSGESCEETQSGSSNQVHQSIFNATVRSALGQTSFNYRISKDGIKWI